MIQNIKLLLPYAVPDWRTGHRVGTCNAMQWKAMQCDGKQCNTMESNAMQWNAMQCNTVEYNAIQWNAVECNVIKCNARQGNGMLSHGVGISQKTSPSLS